jgi:2-dehydro-3-deoxygalactonokinase
MTRADWVALDWGTSHLRAWLMASDDSILEKRQSNAGMAGLRSDEFSGALKALIGPFDGPVIACGMVGSRQGWAEAPYARVPCAPPSARHATHVGRVHILPGIRQDQPADVMRGEETQIAGLLAKRPEFDGVICLPGTHTKWAHISAGEIVSFRTAMTGEVFKLLSDHSVLRHSLGHGWDAKAFETAVSDALARPEALAAALFNIRAEGLVRQPAPDAARARLSGLLVGAELASTRPYWLGQPVSIIGAPEVADVYAQALALQGVQAVIEDAEAMTLGGLIAAKAELEAI